MKLVVGLGNPGQEYEKSRHNVGFMAADSLINELNFDEFKKEKKFNAEISTGILGEEKVIVAKPMTFMNLSGEAVQKIAHFHKIPPRDILVIYDDLDLPLGKIRIRKEGKPGTHNGVKSISQSIGNDFQRVRIGIEGRTPELVKVMDAADYVLSSFRKEEKNQISASISASADASILILRGETDKAMNEYN